MVIDDSMNDRRSNRYDNVKRRVMLERWLQKKRLIQQTTTANNANAREIPHRIR